MICPSAVCMYSRPPPHTGRCLTVPSSRRAQRIRSGGCESLVVGVGAAEVAVVRVPVEFGVGQRSGQRAANLPDLQVLRQRPGFVATGFAWRPGLRPALRCEDVEVTIFAGNVDTRPSATATGAVIGAPKAVAKKPTSPSSKRHARRACHPVRRRSHGRESERVDKSKPASQSTSGSVLPTVCRHKPTPLLGPNAIHVARREC